MLSPVQRVHRSRGLLALGYAVPAMSKVDDVGAKSRAQWERRIATLEESMGRAESNKEWDAMEPELVALRRDIYESVRDHRAELDRARSEYKKTFGRWRHLNPFDSEAKRVWSSTVSRKEFQLESDYGADGKAEALAIKFYLDKTRNHAREFIRIAEKIQRGVTGSWTDKARAVVCAVLAGQSAEEGIERARHREDEVPAGAGRDRIAAAAAYAKKSNAEVEAYLDEAQQRLHGDREADSMITAAAILSGRSPEEAFIVAERARASAHGTWEAEAMIVSAVVLSPQSPDESIAFAKNVQHQLTGSWESEAWIIAAGILAHGLRGRRDPAAEALKAAFLVPGFVTAPNG